MNFRRIDADEVKNNIVNLKQITFEVTDACNGITNLVGTHG